GVELDVHLSRDGVVVVHHDRTLERMTTLRGPVAARSARELAEAGVPALREVLERYREARVIVEMKVNGSGIAAAVVDVVRRADAVDRVCLGGVGRRGVRAAAPVQPADAGTGVR